MERAAQSDSGERSPPGAQEPAVRGHVRAAARGGMGVVARGRVVVDARGVFCSQWSLHVGRLFSGASRSTFDHRAVLRILVAGPGTRGPDVRAAFDHGPHRQPVGAFPLPER